ncbi:MAG TPA: hypothetical protein VHN15_13215 [Thermoanaerobaculia bacterium]|nr:hypothetical protein [Thermoanaerobaculia bacterium]
MLKLTSRAALAGLLLLIATNGLVIFFPQDASAACGYDLTYRRLYYSEPELINQVGQCNKACFGPTTCSGTITDYHELTDIRTCTLCT